MPFLVYRNDKNEKLLLILTYLLCFVGCFNLAILKINLDFQCFFILFVMVLIISLSLFILKRYFSTGDKFIFNLSCILSLIGIIMIYRLEPDSALKQLIWFSVGVTGFIFIVMFLQNFKRYSKFKYLFLALTFLLTPLALIFGEDIYGAKNWIQIGQFSFQPSEIGKLFLVAYLAAALRDYKNRKDLIQPAIAVMMFLIIMVLQTDLGTALIIFAVSITMLYIATSKFKYVFICLLLFSIGAVISYYLFAHVKVRVEIWLDPLVDPYDKSLQIVQSLIAIASGGLFGKGLGLGYPFLVPINVSDFIFSAICEEMGILTGVAVIIINFMLFYRCMRNAIYVKDMFSKLLVAGYSSMLAVQVFIIIGGVTNLIPLTGVTLPFVSYGGTSMIYSFLSIGIIQKISEEDKA